METTDVLKLRVILDNLSDERLTLPPGPESVNGFIFDVKNKLNLIDDFCLQFQYHEFLNAVCNFIHAEELLSKATTKIIQLLDLAIKMNLKQYR